MKHLKNYCLLILHLLVPALCADQADIIIYSYDRPLQLYALLESLAVYTDNLKSAHVIYLVSHDSYEKAYKSVWHEFPEVHVYQQDSQLKRDFKPLTMQVLDNCSSDYVLFAVDDIIVKDYIDFGECIDLLKTYDAYGFYLRLGKNLNYCYSLSRSQSKPTFLVDENICIWRFADGVYDWNYPHTVDMTLYPKQRVKKQFGPLYFANPNSLEGAWAALGGGVQNECGICYEQSKIVNLPINRVQNVCANKHMDLISAQKLLEIFTSGKKIDIDPLYKVANKAAHMEYAPEFVSR